MSDPFIGEIRMFGGNFAPMDWAFCDGQLLQIIQNQALYSLIGNMYGGDGVTNFALPDLRGRLPVHQGNGYPIGAMLGTETATVSESQMASHTHPVAANRSVGTMTSPQNAVWAAADANKAHYAASQPNLGMKSSLVTSAGGGLSHDNMMPYLPLSFIIALNGLYPTRD